MAVNLIDAFREAIGDQTAVKISSYLGESTEKTRSAIGTALPAFLGALLEKGQNLEGAAALLDFIQHEEIDGTILDKLEDILGGGKKTTQLIEKGAGILEFVVPDSKISNEIIDTITSRSGIGRGSSDTLAKMTLPMLMGLVGHQVKSKNLDSQGLSNLLLDQKQSLEKSAPTGLFEKLGFTVFVEKSVEVKEKAATESQEEKEEEKAEESGAPSTMARIIPWIILISIALGLLYIMKSCGGRPAGESLTKKIDDQITTMADTLTEKEDSIASSAKPPAKPSNNTGISRSVQEGLAYIKLSKIKEITVGEHSFVDRFFIFIYQGGEDPYTRFTFDSLHFYDNSANITLTSAEQLQQVASIMQAFPSVYIQIEAYADSEDTGEGNKELSNQRAEAVRNALVEMGIGNDRISSIGQGNPLGEDANNLESKPVGNRIDLFVTRK
ncbi:MAG: OmpA family protein [Saprospiraceae bacterium]|nr:OmpA family protein [Saprospiraceae bacterium]